VSSRVNGSGTGQEAGMHWLGTVLIDLYEADEKHPVKTDLLDQVVGIMRRKDGRDERVRDIANLMRDWQENRSD
jgi:hypothetical protein